ncbi:MAG: Fur family transcriptional regulator [Woeseiaceae bacterium]|nr:Fur family transcriptional regulator [Woeseiaceae bacterium]
MAETNTAARFPDEAHDHDSCVAEAMATAVRICRERGLRLTRQRRRVLELVWNSHKPIGAYEILDRLNRDGARVAPPTVYRALEFLIEAELVHRLDSLNAFVGCPDPANPHSRQFLICRECRSVAELEDSDIDQLVRQSAARLGFEALEQTLEIEGVCRNCAEGK